MQNQKTEFTPISLADKHQLLKFHFRNLNRVKASKTVAERERRLCLAESTTIRAHDALFGVRA